MSILKKGTSQGNPISGYLFILVLAGVFCVIKSNKNINGLKIFNHKFRYTAYVDNTTFLLKDKISVFETLNIFHEFSLVSGLSHNTTKCEIAGTGTLNRVNVALCCMKCLNLTKETVKILDAHFTYNKKLEHMNLQSHIVKIESVLRLWRVRNLTIKEKVLVFKSLTISKIVHLSLIITVPQAIINQLNNTKKTLHGKHSTFSNSYEDSGLKDVDIFTKVASLQCSSIKRLYEENFHE